MFTVQTYFCDSREKDKETIKPPFYCHYFNNHFQLWLDDYVFGVQLNGNFERAYIDIALRNIGTVQKIYFFHSLKIFLWVTLPVR